MLSKMTRNLTIFMIVLSFSCIPILSWNMNTKFDRNLELLNRSSFHPLRSADSMMKSLPERIGPRIFRSKVLMTLVTLLSLSPNPTVARDFAPSPEESQLSTRISDTTNIEAAQFAKSLENQRPLFSDEFFIDFNNDKLGLQLKENNFEGFPIVVVKDITDPQLSLAHPELLPEAAIAEVNGEFVAGFTLKKIANKIQNAGRPVQIKFRDPTRFFLLLDSTLPKPPKTVTTSFLPANVLEAGSPEQVIKIERLYLPPEENRKRAASIYDVLEIQYDAEVIDPLTNRFVDGSALRTSPGSSLKSIYYILGEQNGPPGKFPKGWDIALKGMVVGEVRRITLPYILAYGVKGSKDLNIPPKSDMIYTIKLISLT